jgi:hypothetical protein
VNDTGRNQRKSLTLIARQGESRGERGVNTKETDVKGKEKGTRNYFQEHI